MCHRIFPQLLDHGFNGAHKKSLKYSRKPTLVSSPLQRHALTNSTFHKTLALLSLLTSLPTQAPIVSTSTNKTAQENPFGAVSLRNTTAFPRSYPFWQSCGIQFWGIRRTFRRSLKCFDKVKSSFAVERSRLTAFSAVPVRGEARTAPIRLVV